jgi:hypothetical protein
MIRLSNQAVGAIMLALQKGILEQADITDLLKSFEFDIQEQTKFIFAEDDKPSTMELFVRNPPVVSYNEPDNDD